MLLGEENQPRPQNWRRIFLKCRKGVGQKVMPLVVSHLEMGGLWETCWRRGTPQRRAEEINVEMEEDTADIP